MLKALRRGWCIGIQCGRGENRLERIKEIIPLNEQLKLGGLEEGLLSLYSIHIDEWSQVVKDHTSWKCHPILMLAKAVLMR